MGGLMPDSDRGEQAGRSQAAAGPRRARCCTNTVRKREALAARRASAQPGTMSDAHKRDRIFAKDGRQMKLLRSRGTDRDPIDRAKRKGIQSRQAR